MSRTDKTKPWWVRVAEHSPVEEHNHKNGRECDLPKSPYEGMGDWRGCHYRPYLIWGCCNGCGCGMCTGQEERKAKRRKSRHQSKREMRAAYKELYSQEDFDG